MLNLDPLFNAMRVVLIAMAFLLPFSIGMACALVFSWLSMPMACFSAIAIGALIGFFFMFRAARIL